MKNRNTDALILYRLNELEKNQKKIDAKLDEVLIEISSYKRTAKILFSTATAVGALIGYFF